MSWYGNNSAFGAREANSFTQQSFPTYYPSDLTTTVEPVGLVVSVEAVKQFIVEYNLDSDDLLNVIIAGVTDQIERYLGRDLLNRTRKALYTNVSNRVFVMPVPVTAITLVERLNDDGTATTMTLNEQYKVQGLRNNIMIYELHMDSDRQLQVTFTTGYGSASSVPPAIRQAIIQESSRQFKRRQDPGIESFNMRNELSPETYSLLQSYVVRMP